MAAANWNPPTLPECDGYDAAVLLDTRCYIADLHNCTTAWGTTSRGSPIQVTFCAARPPLLSHFCVRCPDLDFLRSKPIVVATDADLVLLRVPIDLKAPLDARSWDYFVYKPQAHQLDLLPNPHPMSFHDSATALLSREDGAWYAVAAISSWCPVYESNGDSIIRWDFRLHLYRSSDSKGWTTTPVSVEELVRDKLVPLPCDVEAEMMYHKTAKTLPIGGERGTVAWVDLWRGILLCDVLGERPVFQDIPLPVPARGNWGRLLEQCEPNYVRDVAITRHKDTIKYIEMETWPPRKLMKTPDSYSEWVRSKSSITQVIPGGWKATTWSMPIPVGSFTDWQLDCRVEANDVSMDTSNPHQCNLLSRLSGSNTVPILPKLLMAYPTISIDDDIVYFIYTTKPRHMGKLELVIAVDVRNKALRGVAELDAQKKFISVPAFCTCKICKYPRKNTGTAVELKRTEKEAVKRTDKDLGTGKPTRVHVKEPTRTRPPVNKRVLKTLELLQARSWSCPRRLGEQTPDAEIAIKYSLRSKIDDLTLY
ncbi:uncharacterized protein [Triticum aestivum]|nr:uncharacterized protein LOC123136640 isoform X1 [Triticum aestivum]